MATAGQDIEPGLPASGAEGEAIRLWGEHAARDRFRHRLHDALPL